VLLVSPHSMIRNWVVMLLLGYLTTKATCSPHVHVHSDKLVSLSIP
jgi:hypothetical protein